MANVLGAGDLVKTRSSGINRMSTDVIKNNSARCKIGTLEKVQICEF